MWTQGVRSCLRFFPHWTSVEGREARITLNKEDWAEILFKKISHIFQHLNNNIKEILYLHENFQRIILLVWVQRHPNIALYCRFQNQSQSGKGRTPISEYEAGMQLGISPGLRNTFKNCRWKPNCIPASPSPTALQTIFFEVQIHSASFSTKIKKRKENHKTKRMKVQIRWFSNYISKWKNLLSGANPLCLLQIKIKITETFSSFTTSTNHNICR